MLEVATPRTSPAPGEAAVHAAGTALARSFPPAGRGPAARVERLLMDRMTADPELRAALFRFVDVRPACRDAADIARHLADLLADAPESRTATRAARLARRQPNAVVAKVASLAVDRMAHDFIVGEDAQAALPELTRLARRGIKATVDLLGEATVTETEADRYAKRCEDTLRALAATTDDVNLSVKVSALTPLLRPNAPERGIAGARERLRHLLRVAKELDAHLHVDMESFDTREAVCDLTLELLDEAEFASGPSAGIVLQAYLTESPEHLDHLLDWARRSARTAPFVIRLVKGAYWDHEVVEAQQKGWTAPVFRDRAACDRNFEALTRTLLDHHALVGTAIASHNLRSVAHAAAYADATGAPVEFQVLRGLGDDLATALAANGRTVRTYCPVGDLVAGMAYLVRRLLENTSQNSFLAAHAAGTDLDTLLKAP